jgi:hypothetical protein
MAYARCVTDSGAFLIVRDPSSAAGPRDPRLWHQTFTRAYANCCLGLMIEPIAAQSEGVVANVRRVGEHPVADPSVSPPRLRGAT